MVDDLIAFINARLDEDEAAARASADYDGNLAWFDSPVAASGDYTIRTQDGNRPVARIRRADSGGDEPNERTLDPDAAAAHIARHDPARVLREVAAKRAILAEHGFAVPDIGPAAGELCCSSCGAVFDDPYLSTPWPCDTVRILAAVWSDHPGYRDEWKPEQ